MFTAKVCQIALILASIFSIGLCIKCFQCNSAEHKECNDLTVNDTTSPYFKECGGNYGSQVPFCRKVAQKILDTDAEPDLRIIRGCGWLKNNTNADYCRKSDTDFIKRTSCQCFSDACNSSNRIASSIKPIIIIQAVFYFLYFVCSH